jgi:hypothetical protein
MQLGAFPFLLREAAVNPGCEVLGVETRLPWRPDRGQSPQQPVDLLFPIAFRHVVVRHASLC